MFNITIFDNLYDNKTDKSIRLLELEQFERFLYKMSETDYDSKGDAPLMSPASFKRNTTRANDNVLEWSGWAALDIDDFQSDGDIETELKLQWKKYHYICYSTASSTKEQPKFRLVFPLSSSVDKEKIKHFWFALNKEMSGLGDAQTKDLSRMYYVPGNYRDAYNFMFTNLGVIMCPNDMMYRHEYISKTGNSFMDNLPKNFREQIASYKKSEMTNTNITWHNYKDCPFVSNRMVKDYEQITDTGWYAKIYQIMVAIAGRAINRKYPITSIEIAELCKEIDADTGGWYKNRPLQKEADRAIAFIYGQNL